MLHHTKTTGRTAPAHRPGISHENNLAEAGGSIRVGKPAGKLAAPPAAPALHRTSALRPCSIMAGRF